MDLDNKIAEIAAKHGITSETPGFAVAVSRDGELLYRGAFGCADLETGRQIDPDDNFVIASNTKQMCCTCMLILAERGLIDLDEPVRRFFPDFPDYVERITIRQMMAHTAGVVDYFGEGPDATFAPEVLAMRDAGVEEVLEYIKTLGDLEFEPGTSWAYSNSTYVMLGEIVRQVTGMGFGHFLEKEVLRPLGMERSFAPDDYVSRDPWLVEGYSRVDGGFEHQPYDMLQVGFADGNVSSNVDDMLRWHRWLFDGEGPELLSKEWKDLLMTDNTLADGRKTGYGLGLFLGEDGSACGRGRHLPDHAEIWHTGGATGFVSNCSRFVEDGMSVVLLTNDEDIPRDPIFMDVCHAVGL